MTRGWRRGPELCLYEPGDRRCRLLEPIELRLDFLYQILDASETAIRYPRQGALAIDHAGQLAIAQRGLAVEKSLGLLLKLLGGANDGCGYDANTSEGDLRYVEDCAGRATGAEKNVDEPAGAAHDNGVD